MYQPSIFFARTPEERADPILSWRRDDQAFFAAGACHILAESFRQLHPEQCYQMIHIKPLDGYSGDHMYITNGTWAFDHNGWTLEEELLTTTKAAYRKKYPFWDCDRVIIEEDLETFCRENNHRLPSDYPYMPWGRARAYIQQFSPNPPGVSQV